MDCAFCNGNLGQKTILGVCGLSKANAVGLAELGYNKAYVMLGQFLLFRKEDEFFIEWLKELLPITNENALHCCSCIRDWCTLHL
jgi:barrier-to-autointegration factor